MSSPQKRTSIVESPVAPKPLTFSNLFQAADADVIIHSSDNVEFRLHKKYLEFGTGGFPNAETPTNQEIVHLSEPSTTLEMLFQFVYPQLPTFENAIDRMGLISVFNLAEAAEKYEVYGAILACRLKLRDFVVHNSKEVLHFACKYSSEPLIRRLAPVMIHIPLQEIESSLQLCPRFFCAWARYHDRYAYALLDIARQFPRRCVVSHHDTPEYMTAREKLLESGLTQLSEGRLKASELVSTFDTKKIPGGSCCSSYGKHWNETTLKKIAAQITKFPL